VPINNPQISSSTKKAMLKIRIVIFFIFVGLFSLAYQIGAMTTPDEEDADAFMLEFEKLVEDIDGIGIFVHNTSLSLPMFIPGLGVGWGLFSAWSTGYAFAVISSIHTQLEQTPPLTILYLSPFGLMELVAYSMAISRSYIIIKNITKKSNLILLIKPTIIEISIVVGLLFSGGLLEHYLIELAKETANVSPVL